MRGTVFQESFGPDPKLAPDNFAKLKEKRPALRARRIMITHMNPTMLARQQEASAAGFLLAADGLAVEI